MIISGIGASCCVSSGGITSYVIDEDRILLEGAADADDDEDRIPCDDADGLTRFREPKVTHGI